MYQNYNSPLNPLEKHFQVHEVISKRSSTLTYIATFAFGVVIGILVYQWIKNDRNEEYDFKFQEKN